MKKNRPTESMKPPSLGLLPPPYSKNASAAQEGKRLSARSRGSSSVPASNCSTSSISRISSSNKMHTDTEQASTSRSEKVGQEGDDGLGSAGKKRRKKKWSDDVRVDLSCCKYEVLRIAIQKMGWQEAVDDKGWHVFWTDTSIGPERLMTLRRGQKVNHFLGMLQICRKKSLARHLSNMRRMFPAEYKFFPRAFILPNHIQDLVMRLNTDRIRTYILKPDNGCQGRGVVLVQNVADLKQAIGGMAGSNMLAQKYLTNPMLLNGFKFDLRIYVLILSCDPLRLFLYREGLVRFCTEKYMKPEKANLKRSCMHLTNYAVNKNNTKFEFNSSLTETDKGSKWTLSSLFKALAAKGYDIGRLKRQMRKMVVMTIISIVPHLIHNYRNCLNEDDNGRSCFELLGMDVLLDEKCRPWLLEVNHSPSFAIDTPLDFKVKESLLSDTLRLLNVDPSGVSRYKLQDKKGSKLRLYGVRQSKDEIEESSLNAPSHQNSKIIEYDEFERKNLGNYDRIYPPDDPNLQKAYDIFLAGAEDIFKQSFDMKVKSAILKAQEHRKREEMEKEAAEKKKQKKLQNMRKKAQEAAQLAALSQKQRMSLTTSSVDLSDIKETLILDMASPRSSVETPTGWERAFNTLDTMPESRGLAQHAEAKPIHIATKRGALEVVKSNLQQEASTNSMGRNFMSDTGTRGDFDSGSMPFQLSVECDRNPNNDIPTICSPRVSSLPCIVPHSVYRHRIWKSPYSQVLHHGKKQLVSENVPAQPHFSSRTLLELRRENLAKRNASFASATDCHGLRSPFHLPNAFLAEGRDLFACDDGYTSPFRALSMSANIRGGLKSNGRMWPRHAGSK